MGVDNRTEYEGGGVMPNTVHPKGNDALTASDQLRLDAITGQHDDSRAPVNQYHWYGNMRPNPLEDQIIRQDLLAHARALRQNEKDRYRESPY